MNTLITSLVLFSLLMVQSATAVAQGVYVTPGDHGPVFSDKPQSGAKEVTLPPLNIVTPPKAPKRAAPAKAEAKSNGTQPNKPDGTKSEEAAVGYRSFSVVSPEDNGSVVANTAIFEVRVVVDPPLRLGDGDAFVVSINGRPVNQRFTATEFMIPPEFWGDSLPPLNQSLQLDASIVDGVGQVLKNAPPIRFFMRHATVTNHRKRPVHLPLVPPQSPDPKPRPALEPTEKARMKAPVK